VSEVHTLSSAGMHANEGGGPPLLRFGEGRFWNQAFLFAAGGERIPRAAGQHTARYVTLGAMEFPVSSELPLRNAVELRLA